MTMLPPDNGILREVAGDGGRVQDLPPVTLQHGEYRRWHPEHCFLYYTDEGDLKAPFTFWRGRIMRWEEKWEQQKKERQSDSSTGKTSSEP